VLTHAQDLWFRMDSAIAALEQRQTDSLWIHDYIARRGNPKYRHHAQEWASLFVTWGWQTGVSPRVLAAVAYSESNFTPVAKGRTDDHGMFQLVPEWWYNIYKQECGWWNPYDAELSTCYAAHILSDYTKRYGDVRVALAAWNSGTVPNARGFAYADMVLARSSI